MQSPRSPRLNGLPPPMQQPCQIKCIPKPVFCLPLNAKTWKSKEHSQETGYDLTDVIRSIKTENAPKVRIPRGVNGLYGLSFAEIMNLH
jgi:hypothetical protein